MLQRFLRLSVNQRLGVLALLLGLVAIFARPSTGGSVVVDPQDLAVMVQREVDHVTPREVADWIIKGRADYRLVDIRDEKAFATYHVPTAENIPLAMLPDAGLARNERIILYSDGGIHSAQAWFLLRARGFRGVYILRGGLDGWKEEVLFPALSDAATPAARAENAMLAEVSRFFGGAPRAAGMAAVDTPPLPTPGKLELRAGPGAGAKPSTKKKKEGC